MNHQKLRRMNRRELVELIDAMQEQCAPEAVEGLPDREEIRREKERLLYRERYRQTLRSTLYGLLVVAAAATLIATFFVTILRVSGSSMEPTLRNRDVVLLRRTDTPERGEICGFYFENKLLLKRVIGVPGDRIAIGGDGSVSVNGVHLKEPYVSETVKGDCDLDFPLQVPENRYFVLGDHRAVSMDSRDSRIGLVRQEQIVGEVILRIPTGSKRQEERR